MTCIAALQDQNLNIYMGGDSISSSENTYELITSSKVFLKNKMLIGFSGWFRMGQILQYDFNFPTHPKGVSDQKYLISVFIGKLIETIEKKKYSNSTEPITGDFLIAYNKKIYRVDENFQVLETTKKYQSIGCGSDFALASFWTMEKENIEMDPTQKLITSLTCASEFSFVKAPFTILTLEYNTGINRKEN